MTIQQIKEEVEKAVKISIENNHRFMIVFEGSNSLLEILEEVVEIVKKYKDNNEILFVTDDLKKDDVKDILKILEKLGKVQKIEFVQTLEALGLTKDFVVLDCRRTINADDLGRLIDIARGGGGIFLFIPKEEEFKDMITLFHKEVITPPYTLKDVKRLFNKWFLKKLYEHNGIIIIDCETKEVKKKFRPSPTKPERRNIEIPKDRIFPKTIYKLAKTQDQVNTLKELEKIIEKDRVAILIIADRGRGKSASVGLGLAAILYTLKGRKYDIVVTAREWQNASTVFEFLERGLKELEVDYEKISRKKIKYRRSYVTFNYPIDVLERRNLDLLVVDEAAGVYITTLKEYLKKCDKFIFSTTIHGYEGAGRTFSVRFLKILEKEFGENMIKVELTEPIRYSPGDPIEAFVFDVLMLDAEPADLDYTDITDISRLNVKLEKLNLKECFLGGKENLLRQFVGIYVLAHYRNKPNDILLLADAPHHEGWALLTETNKKVVCAIQLAKEGGLKETYIDRMLKRESPKGNIIPDVLCKHYRSAEFPKLRGGRIVRIATHPAVMRKGLGSKALEMLAEELKKQGFDWIGAGFGATYDLLKFWIKNGFYPVHISPSKNEVTGEYSVIVVKPLSEKAKQLIDIFRIKFKMKLLDSLPYLYDDLEPDLARLLLISMGQEKMEKLHIDVIDYQRALSFVNNYMTFEPTWDVLVNIAKQYFLLSQEVRSKIGLTPIEEEILIMKVIQGKSSKKVREYLEEKYGEHFKSEGLKKTLRNIFKKILEVAYNK